MPEPSAAQLHVNRWLTNMAVAWSQDQTNFVASRVFPMVPVQKESDFYLTYEKGSFYRSGQVKARPLGGRPAATGYQTSQGSYRCVEYGLEHLIDDREKANADQPADPTIAGTELLTEQLLIQRDTLWASEFFTTGKWGTDWNGVISGAGSDQFVQWDQGTANDPVIFMRNRRNDIASATGFTPNKAVFGPVAFEGFINNPQVQSRIRYTQTAAQVSRTDQQIVAALLKVDEVLVPYGVSNTAQEGQADNINFIADATSVLLCYAAPAPTIRKPSAGYTFSYTGLLPGTGAFGGVIEQGRDELAHTDVLQARASYDQEIVAPDLGMFFHGVVSSQFSAS